MAIRWKLYGRCSNIIHFLADKLYLPEKVVKRAFDLLDKIIKDDQIRIRIQGKKPTSIAASLVYIAAKLEGERVYQYEIAQALNITELTITKNYQKIAYYMGMEDIIEKGGLSWLKG